jgi:hypothetical protein
MGEYAKCNTLKSAPARRRKPPPAHKASFGGHANHQEPKTQTLEKMKRGSQSADCGLFPADTGGWDERKLSLRSKKSGRIKVN